MTTEQVGKVSEEHKTVLWVNAVSTESECKNRKVEHFRDFYCL